MLCVLCYALVTPIVIGAPSVALHAVLLLLMLHGDAACDCKANATIS